MKNILVLGIITCERDMFGGIVDMDKLTDSDDDQILLKAINEALVDQASDPRIIAGSGYIENGYGNTTKFESYPFNGQIDAEVCIYVDC